MHNKNKKAMTHAERAHVQRIKEMGCVVCGAPGPSEAHEIKQGAWFLSVSLCADCHRDPVLGIHGQKRIWAVKKWDELDALNETIRRMR